MSSHDRREGSSPSERDVVLERAWREASAEQPPAHLDAALIAAAHESVAGRRGQPAEPAFPARSHARTIPWVARWQSLAAAAAVAGLAFVLVPTMMSRDEKLAPSLPRPESTSVPAAAESHLDSPPAPDATAAREVPVPATERQAPRKRDVGTADRPLVQREVPTPPASPAVPPPPASTEAGAADTAAPIEEAPEATFGERSDARSKTMETETAGRAAASAAAAAAQSPATRDRHANDASVLDAAAWAAKIEALHGAGDVAAAERELRAFRAADPSADAYLSKSVRDWARTVE